MNIQRLLQICVVLGFCGLTVFAEAQETNNTETILLGQTKLDTLATLGDIKYYKLDMPQSLEVTLTLTPSGFDARLLLYRANSVAEISEANLLNEVDESEVEETVTRLLSSGTYIVGVADFNNRGTGTYSLSVSTQLFALFSLSSRYGRAPFTVNFSDLSPGASVWIWDFGDGTTGTEQNISHTYTQSGVFSVSMIVANESERDTLTATIIVGLFDDGSPDAGDGTWVMDLDTMDGDQEKRVLDVKEREVFGVELIANHSIKDALNLVVDIIYNPAHIEPASNIEGTVFDSEIDWFVDSGLARFTVNASSPVVSDTGGVGTISFTALNGFTGQTEIWLASAQTGNNNSQNVNQPNTSVVVQNIVPVEPVGPVVDVDCDGDGDVDFQDFLVFVGAFGTKTGEDRFVAACDYSGDGEIGFPDFLIFASNFGRS